MNIFVTSDLHADRPETVGLLRQINRFLQEHASKEDVLLLLGDYANTLQGIETAVQTVTAHFPGTVLTTLGNHDCWDISSETPDSHVRRREVIDLLRACDTRVLDNSPHGIVIGDVGFAGTMGWYDYSYGDARKAHYADYESKQWNGLQWSDGLYCRWQYSDQEVAKREADHLERQLDSLWETGCSRVIVGMHHVPTRRLLFHPRWLVPERYRFLNAFLGSDQYRRLISRYYNVTHVFCGHIHSRKRVQRGETQWQSVGSGYSRKELLVAKPDGSVTSHMFS